MKKNNLIAILFFLAVFIIPISLIANTETNTLTVTTTVTTKKLSKIEEVTSWYMDNMNYGTITLLMAVESSFIPFHQR